MAELYWASQQYDLPSAAENIGEVYSGLANQMRQHGWQGVEQGQDVHGYKPGIDLFAAVQFLYIGGRKFWEVIAVGGGSASTAQAQQEINELRTLVANLKFL